MEDKILIGGDYSGIQGYIYNIASKYASRNLKGRSDTLKKECLDTAERIKQKVHGETIISSGGTFLIMADNTTENIDIIKKCIDEEERYVYQNYGTDIYVAIDYVALSEVHTYQEATAKLFLKRDAKKNRKLANLIKEDYDAFFSPQQWYYDKTDAITGAYFKSESEVKYCKGIGAVTAQTLDQINKGDELKKISKRTSNFNKLIDDDSDLTRLGVLRMDVDNLGATFQTEITKCTTDLKVYKGLSESFTQFFDEKALYKLDPEENIYIVYSGGDDIFAVGQWNHVIAFAEKVHKEFAKQTFVKERNLSISGGVAILPHKYPIMKGAVEGGELEDMAKSHTVGTLEKNSIAFLGMALNWDEEYPVVKELMEQIRDHVEDSSFRSKIASHFASADVKKHTISNYKTYWMLTYDLGRMKQRNSKNIEIVNLIDNCITEICGNKNTLNGKRINSDYHPIELWALACRWAELELRTK